MADLELEEDNTAEKRTNLIATPHDLGPDRLKDFVGNFILEVKPGTTLLQGADRPGSNQFGGIFARGVGNGTGMLALSTRGHGVRGEGAIGVFGVSSQTGFGAVAGAHTGTNGFGIVGDGTGTAAGVLGRNPDGNGHGVRGEGGIGVYGTSSQAGFAAVAGEHSGRDGFGVAGLGSGTAAGVLGRNPDGNGHGVRGEGGIGVFGASSQDGFAAVAGAHTGTSGFGVVGDGTGTAAGVLGRNPDGNGHGVRGEGGIGVYGTSSQAGFAAVAGEHSGRDGFGVTGLGSGTAAGVLGRHRNFGTGIRGQGFPGVEGICSSQGGGAEETPSGHFAGVRGNSSHGPGVFGAGIYGGQFKGDSAQLSLVPAASVGRPTTGNHTKGEIFLDAEANLFVCIASGAPGSWVRVATDPA